MGYSTTREGQHFILQHAARAPICHPGLGQPPLVCHQAARHLLTGQHIDQPLAAGLGDLGVGPFFRDKFWLVFLADGAVLTLSMLPARKNPSGYPASTGDGTISVTSANPITPFQNKNGQLDDRFCG